MPKKKGIDPSAASTDTRQNRAVPADDGRGFRKFKRKICIGAIIRAILFGLSLGAMTGAALWFVDKMTIVEPDFKRYLLVAAAVAGVSAVLMAIILIPTRKRLARRLDRSLALGEKVQTMVAFRGQEGAMLAMQRADTDRILQETPRRRVKGTCTWLFALLPLVAVLCTVGTILVPAKEPPAPAPVVEKTWHLEAWEEQALKDLIREVQESDMEQTPRIEVVTELETLLKRLKSISKETDMKREVIASITDIHTIVSNHNTYDILADAMTTAPAELIRTMGSRMKTLDPVLIGDVMQDVRQSLETDRETATLLAAAIRQSITASKLNATNDVIVALEAFAVDLDALAVQESESDDNALAAMIENHNEALNAALLLQATNEEVEEYVMYKLLSIFGISSAELPEDLLKDFGDDEDVSDAPLDDNTEEDNATSGGAGSGEQIFGSNDTIYDPETDTYVSYGAVLKGYYAKITEMMVDGASPEEIAEALEGYYTILFDGRNNEENKG